MVLLDTVGRIAVRNRGETRNATRNWSKLRTAKEEPLRLGRATHEQIKPTMVAAPIPSNGHP